MKLFQLVGCVAVFSLGVCAAAFEASTPRESVTDTNVESDPIAAIRGHLTRMPVIQSELKEPISDKLRRLIESHQPIAGDFLLSTIANRHDALHRRATNAFVQTWDAMAAEQIDAYLRHSLEPRVLHRARYPQNIAAYVEGRYGSSYGWSAWPTEKECKIKTRTTHFLDGQPYGKPFNYDGPGATTGWVPMQDLHHGRHTVSLALEYEFTHHGKTHRGRIESPVYVFYIVGGLTLDKLVAPEDPETDLFVQNALRVADSDALLKPERWQDLLIDDPFEPPGHAGAQITWTTRSGQRGSLRCPVWQVNEGLPVDLCFEVEIHDVKTGEVFQGDPLVVLHGKKSKGHFRPKSLFEFARDRTGAVPIKIILKPSRALALTCTQVTRYYPREITLDGLTMEVGGKDANDGKLQKF